MFALCFKLYTCSCILCHPSGQPEQRQLFQVPLNESLFSIVTRREYVLPGELPVFHIVVAGTAYRADFIKRYKKSTTLSPK
jgi:hypothetical protein